MMRYDEKSDFTRLKVIKIKVENKLFNELKIIFNRRKRLLKMNTV